MNLCPLISSVLACRTCMAPLLPRRAVAFLGRDSFHSGVRLARSPIPGGRRKGREGEVEGRKGREGI